MFGYRVYCRVADSQRHRLEAKALKGIPMRSISSGKYRIYIENENRYGTIRNAVVRENGATTNRLAIHSHELALLVYSLYVRNDVLVAQTQLNQEFSCTYFADWTIHSVFVTLQSYPFPYFLSFFFFFLFNYSLSFSFLFSSFLFLFSNF